MQEITKVKQKPRAPERMIALKKHPTPKVQDLSSMSADELWALQKEVVATLVAKITAEKEVIENHLRLLNQIRATQNPNNRAG